MSAQDVDPAPAWMRRVIVGMGAAIAALLVALVVVLVPPGSSPGEPSVTGLPTVATPEFVTVGVSLRGREIVATTFGDGPTRVYVLAGIHGDERAAFETGSLLAEHWADDGVPDHVTVRYVANANPDGIVAATRANAAGVDLNRNFPTGDFEPSDEHGDYPLSEPETAAIVADIEGFAPHVIVTLHSEWTGPFTNYDGPAAGLAEAFAEAAGYIVGEWGVQPELPYPTPGSLGTYYGKEIGLPVVTLELSRHRTAEEHWATVRAGMDGLLTIAGG